MDLLVTSELVGMTDFRMKQTRLKKDDNKSCRFYLVVFRVALFSPLQISLAADIQFEIGTHSLRAHNIFECWNLFALFPCPVRSRFKNSWKISRSINIWMWGNSWSLAMAIWSTVLQRLTQFHCLIECCSFIVVNKFVLCQHNKSLQFDHSHYRAILVRPDRWSMSITLLNFVMIHTFSAFDT